MRKLFYYASYFEKKKEFNHGKFCFSRIIYFFKNVKKKRLMVKTLIILNPSLSKQ